ncbi:MAG: ATP-binding protein [Deltaproteobacteria bacterium]|nr:ATP-binding protein [Deltaproteobacteria bacterium]
MLKNRYLTDSIIDDLAEKMVFIGGPRQVGKTTLSTGLVAAHYKGHEYLNWDNRQDRKKITASQWSGSAELIILDEIHKYRKWKTFIKGEYDKLKDRYKFLVTGSSRLDVYRRGGDSLQGRYHYYVLHPFTLAETLARRNLPRPFEELDISPVRCADDFETLLRFGGFPEPLIKQQDRFLRRWHNEKIERLFREDIQDMAQIRDIGSMKMLSDMLPSRVGSLLSANALREDLEVSHRAVTHWLSLLETFYYHFRIYPFAGKAVRSLKKQPKLYLWDWSEVDDAAARFENMVAGHLLKLVSFLHDHEGYRTQLYYLRNVDNKEVDFLVTVDESPWFAVEAKVADSSPAQSLLYFKERVNIPFVYQVVQKSGIDHLRNGVRTVSADAFFASLI